MTGGFRVGDALPFKADVLLTGNDLKITSDNGKTIYLVATMNEKTNFENKISAGGNNPELTIRSVLKGLANKECEIHLDNERGELKIISLQKENEKAGNDFTITVKFDTGTNEIKKATLDSFRKEPKKEGEASLKPGRKLFA